MNPITWASLHPALLACLMGIAFMAGMIVSVLAIKSVAPERDLLREQGGR